MVYLADSVGRFRQLEEGAYQGGQFLDFAEMRDNQSLQVGRVSIRKLADAVVLQVIPYLFIWIEFRGV